MLANTSEKKIIMAVCVLFCVLAAVSAYQGKRGIIVKCQGNPVSCYGKRSAPMANEGSAADNDGGNQLQIDDDQSNLATSQEEANYEKYLERLIRSCKLGVDRSCSTMLRIMLMNSQ